MGEYVTISLKGFEEARRKLESLPDKLVTRGLRRAAAAGAKVIRDAAKETVHVRTGLLKASIISKKARGSRFQQTYQVRVRGVKRTYGNTRANRRLGRAGRKYEADGPAFYGKFVEFGTSKMAPRPFLRPAFLAKTNQAIEAIRQALAESIAEHTK